MFKKLKEKITEEVKSSPQRLQQLLQQQQQQQETSAADQNFFSLSEDDASAVNMEPGFASVPLRRNSNSSIASDVSFLPQYEATANMYHLQSDFEVSASEMEDNASTSSQLGHLSKEQIYTAFQKAQKQHHKYRGRYVDLARHYKELERDNSKMKAVLVETQDKAIRRVAELKEQCNLEQKAKAHLENALRVELDEKQYKIETLQTQIGLLQQQSASDETETLAILERDLNDARGEIENLNAKLQEFKANNIVFQSKENNYRNKIAALEKEIVQYTEREKENNLKLAENKMELHNELLRKDAEISNLKTELETLRQTNLQVQNKKLIDKVESLTQKCNNYESELLKIEQYKSEIEMLRKKLDDAKEIEEKFEAKLEEQRDSAKKALLSLEMRIKEQIEAEHADKEQKIRSEFLQKIESLTTNQDEVKELQMKLFEREDYAKNVETQNLQLTKHLDGLQEKYNELEKNHLELISEAAQQRNNIASLKKQLEDTKQSNNAFESEISRLTGNLKKLEDVLNKVKNEKSKITEENKQIENEKVKFLEEMKNKDEQCEMLKLQLQNFNQTSGEREIFDLRTRLQETIEQLEEIKSINEHLKLEITNKNADLKKDQVEINEKTGVIAELEMQLKAKIEQLGEFEKNKEILKVELEKEISDLEKLKNHNHDLLNENVELKAQLQEKIVQFGELNNKNETLTFDFNKQLSELQQIKNQNQDVLNENADLKMQLQKKLEQFEEIKTQNETLTLDFNNEISALQQIKNQNQDLLNENADLKMQLQEKLEQFEELKTENETLTLDFNKKNSELQQLKIQNQDLLHRIEQETQKIAELKTQQVALKENYQKQNETLQMQHANKAKELENKYLLVLDENQGIKETIQELRKTNEQLKIKSDELKIENEALNVIITELKATKQKENANLQANSEKLKAEIEELQKRNVQLALDSKTFSEESLELLNQLSEVKIKLDIAQIETNNYKEIADKIAGEKQVLLEEMNNLKADLVNVDAKPNVDELKTKINDLILENGELKNKIENSESACKERNAFEMQLKELEHQYSEILHEKQLLQDEVQELKISPLNLTENRKLDNLNLLKTGNNLPLKEYEEEINQLHEKLIQYQSMDLTNKSSIEFYQNEVEKLKIKNEKLNRKLDETLVTLNHCADLSNSTEIEYLKNVLFNYMLGKESLVLARVIAAVCKFDEQQTELILQKEQQRQSLLGQLGIL